MEATFSSNKTIWIGNKLFVSKTIKTRNDILNPRDTTKTILGENSIALIGNDI